MFPSMMIVALFELPPVPMCFTSEVQEACCPSACAVRAKRMPSDGDRALRACLRGMGCEDESATVGMRCECGANSP